VRDFFQLAWHEFAATSAWEWTAVVLAFAYLLLAVRRSQWCWGAALISSVIYLVLMAHAHLYMQTLLQVFYLAMAVYGYLQWRSERDQVGELEMVRWSWSIHMAVAGVVLIVSALNGWLLSSQADAHAPYLDAFVTWGSVVTTWMVARRVIENWLYWIVVDAVAAGLYFDQGLRVTALLFIAYIGIVIHGYFVWRRTEQQGSKCVATNSVKAGVASESH
jgi:nicotinamide mononucleotide transporter